jgi:hypothetical protein
MDGISTAPLVPNDFAKGLALTVYIDVSGAKSALAAIRTTSSTAQSLAASSVAGTSNAKAAVPIADLAAGLLSLKKRRASWATDVDSVFARGL